MGFEDLAKRVRARNADITDIEEPAMIEHTLPAQGDDAERLLRERARAEERDEAWRTLWMGIIVLAGGLAVTATQLTAKDFDPGTMSMLGVTGFCFGMIQIIRGVARLRAR